MAQQIGVIAKFDDKTAAGINSYIRHLNKATHVTIQNTVQVGKISQKVNEAGAAMRRGGGDARYFSQELRTLGSTLSTALGTSVGFIVANVVRNIVRGFQEITKETLEVITFFERLEIGTRQLIAEEMFLTGQVESMTDALVAAVSPAQDLVRWMENLAILSPFNFKDVALAFQQAQAFGFNVQSAQSLTAALTDLASARMWEGDRIQRIAYALGQVYQATRLTGLETRQLTEAGVPMIRLLADHYQKTTREIQDMTQDGLVPAGVAIGVIMDYIEKTAAGAAERTATTFSGLIASIEEVRALSLRDLFQGVGEAIRPILQSIVDTFLQPGFRAALKEIGALLGVFMVNAIEKLSGFVKGLYQAWNQLDPAVKETIITFTLVTIAVGTLMSTLAVFSLLLGALSNPFIALTLTLSAVVTAWTVGFDDMADITSKFVTSLGNVLGDAADQAVAWGSAIIESLSDGIASAVDLVVDAVMFIADTLAYFMQAFSPPRMLPKLDEWGRAAADVYLQGWTQADFGVIGDFSDNISKYLTSLVSTGQLPEIDVPRLLIGSRQAIAQAIDEIKRLGAVTQETMEAARQAAGPAGDALTTLLRLYSDVALSTVDAEKAQNKLNEVTAHYTALLEPLRRQLEGITDAQQDVADSRRIASLQNVINNAATSTLQKEEARLEIERIRATQRVRNLEKEQDAAVDAETVQVTAAEKAVEAAEDALAVFQARLDLQVETISLYGDEMAILDRVAKQASSSAKEKKDSASEMLDALKDQLRIYTLQQEELADMIKLEKAKATLMDDSATAAEKAAAYLTIQQIMTRRQIRDIEAAELGIDLSAIRETVIVFDDWGTAADKAKDKVADLGESVLNLDYSGITALDDATGTFSDTLSGVNEKILGFQEKLEGFREKIQPLIDNWQLLAVAVGGFIAILVGSKLVAGILGIVGAIKGAIGAAGALATAIGSAGALPIAIGVLIAAVAAWAVAWLFNWGEVRENTAAIIGQLQELFDPATALAKLQEWAGYIAGWVITAIAVLITYGPDWIIGLIGWIANAWTVGLPLLGELIGSILAWIIGTGIPELVKGLIGFGLILAAVMFDPRTWEIAKHVAGVIVDILAALAKGIVDMLGSLLQFGANIIAGIASGITQALTYIIPGSTKDMAKAFVSGMFSGLFTEIEAQKQKFKDWTDEFVGNFKDALGIDSPSKVFAEMIGIPAGMGIIEGLLSTRGEANRQITGYVSDIAAGFESMTLMAQTETQEMATQTTGILDFMRTESVSTVDLMVTEVERSYDDLLTETKIGGQQVQIAMVIAFSTMRNSVRAEMVKLLEEVQEKMGALILLVNGYKDVAYSAGTNVGTFFGNGIVYGILSKQGAIAAAAAKVVNSALNAAKQTAGIHSPSRVAAREVGAPIAEGIALGISKNMGLVTSAVRQINMGSIGVPSAQMRGTLPGSSSVYNSTRNYNLHLNTTQGAGAVQRSFATMEVMSA